MSRPLALLVSLLAACGGTSPVASGPAASPEPPAAALAPFPYTPEQLRGAFPVGRTLTYELVDGDQTVILETRFTAVTAEAATMETVTRDGKGAAVGAPQTSTTPWLELVHHASYPAATTSIDDVAIDTPSGRHPAKKYVVRRPDDKGRPSVTIAYFDTERAGPPVRMLVEVDGAIVQRLALVGDKVAP